ncbi:MAG: hypothetical protein JWM69_1036 [Candidatus Binatus sp.]|jgi:hypothetical protein|nr:hypothetical protein [Candidatus Binatus sp.]
MSAAMRHEPLLAGTELTPEWTSTTTRCALGWQASRTGSDGASRGKELAPAGSPSVSVLESTLITLQKRTIAILSPLLLVFDLILLTMGGMAYELLD